MAPTRRSRAQPAEEAEAAPARSASRARGKSATRAKKAAKKSEPEPEPDPESEEEHEPAPKKGASNASRKAAVSRQAALIPSQEDPLPGASGGSLLGKLVVAIVVVVAAAAAAIIHLDIAPVNASQQQLDVPALRSLAFASKLRGQDAKNPLTGAQAIVTGATSGLGQATATELYGLGATVILASRNAAKCKGVQATIQAAYPKSPGKLDCSLTLDLADLSTVTAFAKAFARKYTHATLLVNNAGMHYVSAPVDDAVHRLDLPMVSSQGYDYSFSSNYLGHYLLTKLLLPGMISAEANTGRQGRIINVASSYHLQSDGTMLRPSGEGEGEAIPEAARSDVNTFTFRNRAYANSKFAQVLHAKELQKRLKEQGKNTVRVHSVCPAWVSTGILPDNAGGAFVSRHAFTPKAASVITIGAALRNDFQGGEFVAIFQNWFTTQTWSHAMFSRLTQWGIRDAASNALSMFILASQGKSYGVHVQPSSPEADDAELARALFDWSNDAVTKFVDSEAAAAVSTKVEQQANAVAEKHAADALKAKAEAALAQRDKAMRAQREAEIHVKREIAAKKAEDDRIRAARSQAMQQAEEQAAKSRLLRDQHARKRLDAEKQAKEIAEAKVAQEKAATEKAKVNAEKAKADAAKLARAKAKASAKLATPEEDLPGMEMPDMTMP